MTGERERIYSLDATVYSDGTFDIQEHNSHAVGFVRSRAALVIIRDELNRLIEAGPYLCPHAKKNGMDLSE